MFVCFKQIKFKWLRANCALVQVKWFCKRSHVYCVSRPIEQFTEVFLTVERRELNNNI